MTLRRPVAPRPVMSRLAPLPMRKRIIAGTIGTLIAIPTLILIEHRQSVSDELPPRETTTTAIEEMVGPIGQAASIEPGFCDFDDMLEFELTADAFGYPAGSRICLHIDQVNDMPVVMDG